MSGPEIVLDVAAKAAIVNSEGKVLILREAATNPDASHVGKYHLPGGRIDKGETFIDGLHREVDEETSLKVEPLHPIHVDEWRPVIRGTVHQIVAVFVLCKPLTSDIRLSKEHDRFVWIDPAKADAYELLVEDARAVEAVKARR